MVLFRRPSFGPVPNSGIHLECIRFWIVPYSTCCGMQNPAYRACGSAGSGSYLVCWKAGRPLIGKLAKLGKSWPAIPGTYGRISDGPGLQYTNHG
jgi:hypothetical protein